MLAWYHHLIATNVTKFKVTVTGLKITILYERPRQSEYTCGYEIPTSCGFEVVTNVKVFVHATDADADVDSH